MKNFTYLILAFTLFFSNISNANNITNKAIYGSDNIVEDCVDETETSMPEICDNGIDDDGDGLIDCYDPDCSGNLACDDFYYGQTDACQYTPGTSAFEMQENWQVDTATADIFSTLTPVAGDWDNDGVVEVFAYNHNGDDSTDAGTGQPTTFNTGDKIFVINGETGVLETTITRPVVSTTHKMSSGMALGDLDNDGFGELLVLNADGTITCFEHTGVVKWTSPSTSAFFGGNVFQPTINIADFDQDGNPEIYAAHGILNGQTGAIIGTASFSFFGNPRGAPINSAQQTILYPMSVAADVLPTAFCADCGGLEIVAGNAVYAVNVGTGNVTLQVSAAAPTGMTVATDGFTALADYDKDGDLDAVIGTNRQFGGGAATEVLVYVWDIQTSTVIATSSTFNSPTFGNNQQPTVADFDGDGLPEISFVYENNIIVLDDHTTVAAGIVPALWSKTVSDNAGFNNAAIFDFQGDGKSEIVYQDENTLYVLDGTTGAELATQPCFTAASSAILNRPIVLDIDGDNQAEIVCGCSDDPDIVNRLHGTIKAFGASGESWLTARKVWNQYSYYNTNINDDLSVPIRQQDQHTLGNSTILNMFNGQSTELTSTGTPTFSATDASLSITSVDLSNSGGMPATIDVTLQITNESAEGIIPSNTPISFYNGDPSQAGATLISTLQTSSRINVSSNISQTFTIADQGNFILYAVVQDRGLLPTPISFPNNGVGECDYTNNTAILLIPNQFTYDSVNGWTPNDPSAPNMGDVASNTMSDIIIQDGTATVSGTFDAATITVEDGATFDSDSNISLDGGITLSGTGLLDVRDAALNVDQASTFTGTGLLQVGDITVASGENLTNAVDTEVYGLFSAVGANVTLDNINGSLTFKSTATQTGRVGSGTIFVNDVVVERFITGNRAFRLLTAPLENAGTVQSNYQEAVNNTAETDAMGTNNLNPNPGFGTHITGTGGSAAGFDVTATNNNSMFTLAFGDNPGTAGTVENGYYEPIASTNATNLEVGVGYLTLVRGARTADNLITNAGGEGESTVLRATGDIVFGDFDTFTLNDGTDFVTGGNGSSLIGNPYQAVVDMEVVLNGATSIEPEFYHVYDATLGDNGAFITVTFDPSMANDPSLDDTTLVFPASNPDNPDENASNATRYLLPGQAIFVNTIDRSAAGNPLADPPVLEFSESDKVDQPGESGVFLTPQNNTINKIVVGLYQTQEFNSGHTPRDGTLLRFGEFFNNDIGPYDAPKLFNIDESIATSVSERNFSIQSKFSTEDGDVVPLFITNYRTEDYTLRFALGEFNNSRIFLVDSYLNTETELLNNGETLINFSLLDETSKAADRFSIRFEEEVLNLSEFTALDFGLYPNPTKGTFNIRFNDALDGDIQVTLFNLLGQQVIERYHDLAGGELQIITKNLQSGVYLVEVKTETSKVIKRLIIE